MEKIKCPAPGARRWPFRARAFSQNRSLGRARARAEKVYMYFCTRRTFYGLAYLLQVFAVLCDKKTRRLTRKSYGATTEVYRTRNVQIRMNYASTYQNDVVALGVISPDGNIKF